MRIRCLSWYRSNPTDDDCLPQLLLVLNFLHCSSSRTSCSSNQVVVVEVTVELGRMAVTMTADFYLCFVTCCS